MLSPLFNASPCERGIFDCRIILLISTLPFTSTLLTTAIMANCFRIFIKINSTKEKDIPVLARECSYLWKRASFLTERKCSSIQCMWLDIMAWGLGDLKPPVEGEDMMCRGQSTGFRLQTLFSQIKLFTRRTATENVKTQSIFVLSQQNFAQRQNNKHRFKACWRFYWLLLNFCFMDCFVRYLLFSKPYIFKN